MEKTCKLHIHRFFKAIHRMCSYIFQANFHGVSAIRLADRLFAFVLWFIIVVLRAVRIDLMTIVAVVFASYPEYIKKI